MSDSRVRSKIGDKRKGMREEIEVVDNQYIPFLRKSKVKMRIFKGKSKNFY